MPHFDRFAPWLVLVALVTSGLLLPQILPPLTLLPSPARMATGPVAPASSLPLPTWPSQEPAVIAPSLSLAALAG